jgi:hypothetical protein
VWHGTGTAEHHECYPKALHEKQTEEDSEGWREKGRSAQNLGPKSSVVATSRHHRDVPADSSSQFHEAINTDCWPCECVILRWFQPHPARRLALGQEEQRLSLLVTSKTVDGITGLQHSHGFPELYVLGRSLLVFADFEQITVLGLGFFSCKTEG